jgi:hypothetical protein
MKLTIGFWIALAIMAVLFILPTISTYSAPFVDGIRVYGFPLIFNSEGGDCLPPGCDHTFSYLNLIIDLLILSAIPFIVNFIILKVRK